MSKMLKFSPDQRIDVEASLMHPFLESMHSPDDEPVADFHATFDFEAESTEGRSEEWLTTRYKQLIWDEIRSFHPELPSTAPISVKPAVASPAKKSLLDNNNSSSSPVVCSSVATIAWKQSSTIVDMNHTPKSTSLTESRPGNHSLKRPSSTPMSPPTSVPVKRLRAAVK